MKIGKLLSISLLTISLNIPSVLAIDLDKINKPKQVNKIQMENIKGKITKKLIFQRNKRLFDLMVKNMTDGGTFGFGKSIIEYMGSYFFAYSQSENIECNYTGSKNNNISCMIPFDNNDLEKLERLRRPGFLKLSSQDVLLNILINDYGFKITYEEFPERSEEMGGALQSLGSLFYPLLKYYGITLSGCKKPQKDGLDAGTDEINQIKEITNGLKNKCFSISNKVLNNKALESKDTNYIKENLLLKCLSRDEFEEKISHYDPEIKNLLLEEALLRNKPFGDSLYRLANDYSNFLESAFKESLKKGTLKKDTQNCTLLVP